MPRPRFSRLPPDRQRQILERAAEEFAAHGYLHASLNHIIAALGLNKGVFYYYFDGKADLFGAVIQMVWDVILPPGEFAIDGLDAASFWPSLEELFRRGHALMGVKPWVTGVARLLLDEQPPPGAAASARELLERGHTWAEALLSRGQQLGVVRTDVTLQYLLAVVSAADQASDRWMLANWERLPDEERARSSARTLDLWRRVSEPARPPREVTP